MAVVLCTILQIIGPPCIQSELPLTIQSQVISFAIRTSSTRISSLQWRHNGRDGVPNHQPRDCLLNRLFGCRSKETSNLRATGLCEGNSPVTGEFPAQRASNAENVFIWWRHHVSTCLKVQTGHIRCIWSGYCLSTPHYKYLHCEGVWQKACKRTCWPTGSTCGVTRYSVYSLWSSDCVNCPECKLLKWNELSFVRIVAQNTNSFSTCTIIVQWVVWPGNTPI